MIAGFMLFACDGKLQQLKAQKPAHGHKVDKQRAFVAQLNQRPQIAADGGNHAV